MTIEADVLRRVPFRVLAERYDQKRSALATHAHEHMAPILAEARLAERESLLAQVDFLCRTTLSMIDDYRDRHPMAAIGAVREFRETIELLARLTGQLDIRLEVSALASPDWQILRERMTSALAAHPDALEALIEAIDPHQPRGRPVRLARADPDGVLVGTLVGAGGGD